MIPADFNVLYLGKSLAACLDGNCKVFHVKELGVSNTGQVSLTIVLNSLSVEEKAYFLKTREIVYAIPSVIGGNIQKYILRILSINEPLINNMSLLSSTSTHILPFRGIEMSCEALPLPLMKEEKFLCSVRGYAPAW